MGLGNPSVAIWQLTECFKVRALVVYVMQLNREHFRSIIFYNGVDELNNSKSMNLIQFFAMKLLQVPAFIDGMMNSTEVVVHSTTYFLKIVKNSSFSGNH